jgi:protein TonB
VTLARNTLAQSFLLAALLHGAALGWVALRTASPPRRPVRLPTTVRLVSREKPPEPRRLEEKPPARPIAAVRPNAPAPRELPAAPPAPTPPGPPPQPRRFAVSMDAVAPAGAGGIAMPTTAGRTAARGDPSLPSSVAVGDNTAYADATEVDRAPRLLRQPSGLDLRALYPEAARREGIEGNVRLELLVSEAGAVVDARVVERAGNGFDEAAVTAARRMAFSPAVRGGRPVAVRIPWTLKFRLDG